MTAYQQVWVRGCDALRRAGVVLVIAFSSLTAAQTAMADDPNRPLTADERRAVLDKHYPFLDRGAEPPGRWVPDGRAGSVWRGQTGWRTRHGPAVVRWDLGSARNVTDALYPDGSRGEVNHTLDHGFRHRGPGPRLWTYGTIDIRPEDVAFIDGQQPVYAPPPASENANLERELASDPAFLDALKDHSFARAVYKVFMNREFVRAADLKMWSCGDRQAARLVAGLRGIGESYHDYYLDYDFDVIWPDDRPARLRLLRSMAPIFDQALLADSRDPQNAERAARMEAQERRRRDEIAELERGEDSEVMLALRAHLTRLGWRTATEEDDRRLADAAMRDGLVLLEEIKLLESRPAAEPGAWWQDFRRASGGRRLLIASRPLEGLTPDERDVRIGLRRRIDALGASGRVDQGAFEALRLRSWAIEQRVGRGLVIQ